VPSTGPRADYRVSILIARVSAAPLYALPETILAFVVAGFVLCSLTLRDREPAETGDVQARLSITDPIANRSELRKSFRARSDSSMAKTFAWGATCERRRVGVLRSGRTLGSMRDLDSWAKW
jgi:hypothetical protein